MLRKNEQYHVGEEQLHAEEERLKKIRAIGPRLEADLKELFQGHFWVIPIIDKIKWAEPHHDSNAALDSSADIFLSVDPKTAEVNDVREFLRTEPDLEISSEGQSPIFNNSYHAFYLKLKE